jgi:hypothetical protein
MLVAGAILGVCLLVPPVLERPADAEQECHRLRIAMSSLPTTTVARSPAEMAIMLPASEPRRSVNMPMRKTLPARIPAWERTS